MISYQIGEDICKDVLVQDLDLILDSADDIIVVVEWDGVDISSAEVVGEVVLAPGSDTPSVYYY